MIETKILSHALRFCDEHKSKYTGCIHFKNDREETRDVIPLVENILYGIAQVTTLSKEKAEKGLLFIERMFAFFTEDGFVGFIHDFPHVYHDRTNVWIALSLSFFLKNFSKVIPSANRRKIESVLDQLTTIIEKRSLHEVDQYIFDTALMKSDRKEFIPQSLQEYEILTLCKLLMGEKVVLPWHEALGVYTGPLEGVYYRGFEPLPSLIAQCAGKEADHVSALYGSLLPKKGIQDLISFSSSEREDLVINHQKDKLSIHFENHSLVAEGEFDVQCQGDEITFILDEFEEIAFYITDHENSTLYIDDTKATAFYQEDVITLTIDNKQLKLKFISRSHNFMGHIMKGNRNNQLIDCNRNFSLFDHKLLIRRVL